MRSQILLLVLPGISSLAEAAMLQSRSKGSTHTLSYQKNAIAWHMDLKVTKDKDPVKVTLNSGYSAFWLQTDEKCKDVDGDWGRFKPKTDPLDVKMDFNGTTGHVTGPVYFDKVCADDQCSGMTFGASDKCDLKDSSGVLGLGKETWLDKPGFLEALYADNYFKDRTMTFKLQGDGKENTVRFGATDSSASILMNSSQVDNWTGRGVPYVNDKALGNVIDYVFDFGVDSISMPDDIVQAYFKTIPDGIPPDGEQKWGSVKCGTKPPDLKFVFDGKDFAVSGDALTYTEELAADGLAGTIKSGECRRAVLVSIGTSTIGVIGAPGWFEHVIMLNDDLNFIAWADSA